MPFIVTTCVGGHHQVDFYYPDRKQQEVPLGWRKVPVTPVDGHLLYNSKSDFCVYVCPKCSVEGEPGIN